MKLDVGDIVRSIKETGTGITYYKLVEIDKNKCNGWLCMKTGVLFPPKMSDFKKRDYWGTAWIARKATKVEALFFT